MHRPFYPNGKYKGRLKEDLFRGHGVSSLEPLLRRCDRGGNGKKQACCLFWTLGPNQVGKATIIGWRDVLAPAVRAADVGVRSSRQAEQSAFESLTCHSNCVLNPRRQLEVRVPADDQSCLNQPIVSRSTGNH